MSLSGGSIKGGESVDENGVPLTGCLELGIIAGMGLPKAEFLKKSNTFVTVTFNNELIGQTGVFMSSQDPEWDASFVIPVPYGRDLGTCSLELHVYHQKSESKNVLLGYRRLCDSELLYLGSIAEELAAHEQASQSEAQSEDGDRVPPADLGVFELHMEHKAGESPKKTKGRLQLTGHFHPHLSPVLVQDEDEDEDEEGGEDGLAARRPPSLKKRPHRAYLALEVQLLAALDIANANGIAGSFQGRSNPFGIFRLNGIEVHRTAVLADTLSPTWHDEVVELRIPASVDFLNVLFELELWHSAHPRKAKRTHLLGYRAFNANQIAEMAGVTVLQVMCSAEHTHKQMTEYYDGSPQGEEEEEEAAAAEGKSPGRGPQRAQSKGSLVRQGSSRVISRGPSSAGLSLSPSFSLGERGSASNMSAASLEGGSSRGWGEALVFEKGLPVWLELLRHMQRPKEDALLVQGRFSMSMNFKTPPSAAEALAPLPLGKELQVLGEFNTVHRVPTRDAKQEAVLVVSVMAIRGLCVQESLLRARQDAAEALAGSSRSAKSSLQLPSRVLTGLSPPPLYCALRNMFGEIVGKSQVLMDDLSTRWQGQRFWLSFPVDKHAHFPCVFNLEVYHRAGGVDSAQDVLVGEVTISAKDVLRACRHPDHRLHPGEEQGDAYNPFVPASGLKWFRLERPPEELALEELLSLEDQDQDPGRDQQLGQGQSSTAVVLLDKEKATQAKSMLKHQISSLNHGKGIMVSQASIKPVASAATPVHVPAEPTKAPAAGAIELKFQLRPPPYTEDVGEEEAEQADEFATDIVVDRDDLLSLHSECEESGEVVLRVPCLRGGTSKDPSKKKKLGGGRKNCKVFCVVYWNGVQVGTSNTQKLAQVTKFDRAQEYVIPLPLSQKLDQCHLEVELFRTTPCKLSPDHPLGFTTSSMGCVQLRGKALREQLFERREEEEEGEDAGDDLQAGKCQLPLERSHRALSEEPPAGGAGDAAPEQQRQRQEQEEEVGGFLDVTGKYVPPDKPVYTPAEELPPDSDLERELAYSPAFLSLNVCEAAGLGNADLLGRSDPYVVVIWNGMEEGRTCVIQNTLNPVWEDQTFRLLVPRNRDVLHCTLELHVFDDNTVGTDVFLGCRVLGGPALQQLLTNTADEQYPPPVWLDLKTSRLLSKKQNRLVQGSLSVVCQYTESFRQLRRYSFDHVKIELFLFAGESVTKLHGNRKPNSFCVVRWGGREVGRTAAVRKAFNPKWDFQDEALNRFTIYFPDKHLDDEAAVLPELEVLLYHSALCKHSERLEDCLCLGRAALSGQELRTVLARSRAGSSSSSDSQNQLEIHPFRLLLGEAAGAVCRRGKPLEPRGSLEVGVLVQHAECRRRADQAERDEAVVLRSDSGVSDLENDEEDEDGMLRAAERLEDYDSFDSHFPPNQSQAMSQELFLYTTPKTQSRHRMFFNHESASFYYIDQDTQQSSWDKPVDGEIALFRSEEQLRAAQEAQEAFVLEKEARLARMQLVVRNIRADYAEEREREQLDARLAADRVVAAAWRQALGVASRDKGECNIAWQQVPVVHPMAYDFHKTYGLHLRALRLVGCGIESLPEEVFEQLHTLEVLSLSNNKLRQLPDSLCSLYHLQQLDVRDNVLTQLPARIGRMATHLSRIELTNNQLEFLPSSFAALQKIERIDLTFNCLKTLPENLDLMPRLKVLKVNNNKLLRLPRCLGRMRAIISFSANTNLINYIPTEAAKCRSLEVLRLCQNRISYLPENIGSLENLRELWLDHNFLSMLPTRFCGLDALRVLHLEENRALTSPDMEVVHQGAQAVVAWCRARFLEDEHWRRKRIIVAFQDCLRQAAEAGICDPGKFHSPLRVKDDDYYCLDLPYFWKFILPELTKTWKRQIERYDVIPVDVTLSFPYTKQEVLWAFKSFTDAYGYVLQTGMANFRRCLCRDEKGNRRPCVPPVKGFMCRRRCHLVKHTVVLQHEREQRFWAAHKRAETETAVERAEADALKYLKSDEGRLWIAEMSFELAEELMNKNGANHRLNWREKLAEERKNKIVKKWDKKKAKYERSRQVGSAQILLQVEELKRREKTASDGGYAKESIGQQLAELYEELANLPEVGIIEEFTRKCEQECGQVEDDLLYNDSTDTSDNQHRETYRQRKQRLLMEQELEARQSVNGAMPVMWEEPAPTPLMDFVMSALEVIPPKERREKQLRRGKRRLKRRLRNAMDIVSMRYTKMRLMAGGDFKEMQQELEHETYHQHISTAKAQARRAAERQFYVIGKIRNQWKGLGVEVCFLGWKKYTKDKTKRDKADLRATFRLQTKKFQADLINYRIAEAQLLMWRKYSDVYTDVPFWKHWQSGETVWVQPAIRDFVPNGFDMPKKPTPLPDGMSADTSDSDQDDAKFKAKGVFREQDQDVVAAAALKEAQDADDASSVVSLSERKLPAVVSTQHEDEESESLALVLRRTEHSHMLDADAISTTSSELTMESAAVVLASSSIQSQLQVLQGSASGSGAHTRAVVPRNVDNDFSGQQWAPVTVHDQAAAAALTLPSIFSPQQSRSQSQSRSRSLSRAQRSLQSATLHFPLTSSRQDNVLQSYSYGPDSLRAKSLRGRVGRALFQDAQELAGYEQEDDDASVLSFDPGPEGQALLDAYDARKSIEDKPRLTQQEQLAEALEQTARRSREEQEAAMAQMRSRRIGIRKVQGITYLRQRDRRPRAHQDLYEERKRREKQEKSYARPTTPELLKMVQGHPDDVWRSSDIAKRTDLASKAVKLKESMRVRAVKEGLVEGKSKSFFQEHLMPLITDDYNEKVDPNYD